MQRFQGNTQWRINKYDKDTTNVPCHMYYDYQGYETSHHNKYASLRKSLQGTFIGQFVFFQYLIFNTNINRCSYIMSTRKVSMKRWTIPFITTEIAFISLNIFPGHQCFVSLPDTFQLDQILLIWANLAKFQLLCLSYRGGFQ